MMTFGTNEELCRVSQFVDHLIQQCVVSEIPSPTAKLGNYICDDCSSAENV